MPPRGRKSTTTTPDEAQAVTVEELTDEESAQAEARWAAHITSVDTPPTEPATGPDTPSGVTNADQLTAASMAGLLGELKALTELTAALTEGHNITLERMQERDDAMAELSTSMDAVTSYFNDRIGSIEVARDTWPRAEEPPSAIGSAVWAVMNDVQGIGKHGVMAPEGGGYAFRKYDDLKREIGAACRRHGIALQAETLGCDRERVGRMVYVTVKIRYLFTSLVDGSVMTFESYGEGSSTTDKATGKAMTMALKSTMDQMFLLAMEDIDDPDATNEEPEPAPNPAMQRAAANPRFQRAAQEPPPPAAANPDYQVGDRVTVAGQTFVKHSDGPGFPNGAPRDNANPWDQGPPPERPAEQSRVRTPEESAQAAVAALAKPRLTMADWTAISAHAQELGLMETLVRLPDGQETALKYHLLAVGKTL